MSKNPRVVGAYAQTAVETALHAGVSAAQIAQSLQLPDETSLALPETVTAPAYLRFLADAAEQSGDACFGLHVGERMRLATFAVYGLVLMACRTFGEAMEQVMRFESLAHDLGRSSLRIEGGEAIYEWHSPYAPDGTRHLPESVFAGILSFANWMAQRPLPVYEVAFPHAAPADDSEYRRIFAAPLRFGVPLSYARFDAAILSWPLPNADTSLFEVLTQHADKLLAERTRQLAEPAILGTVRQHIGNLLTRDGATLAAVAETMAVAPRTLQRRLTEAGATFQQVLDSTRRELAAGYLARDDLSLTDIAFLLGFSEQSSFSHAFRDWYGQSPASYRAGRRPK